jgi:3-deoxy-D-manno-octulosonic-acid transferase|tara:strand:+ start:1416 stop:2690 length:1275 start_codon:yes stop_codon:yes gene_type:complete
MFSIYRLLTRIFFPIFIIIIYVRKLFGKENSKSLNEKIYTQFTDHFTNAGENIIWFHGASIGEIMSIVPIINHLIKNNKSLKILISSVTVSSAKLIEKEFDGNSKVLHHYFPLDLPHIIKKFLKHWKPNAVVFVDSEIWPNFIHEIKKKEIPLMLINGRITKKTFKRWILSKKFAQKVFSSFDTCLASSNESLLHLKNLGAKNIKYFGNLKYISTSKKINKLNKLTVEFFKNRRVWCAASTHKGEELICIKTHLEIKKKYNNVLTIIIPRHINRVKNIFSICKKHNLNVQILDNETVIKNSTEIILINSFGSLEKYYDYCKSVFVGKSLVKKLRLVGGQNPIEAAKLGCKIYHGPYIYNFLEVYEYLNRNDMAEPAYNENDLSKKIMKDFETFKHVDKNKIDKINTYGENILKSSIEELNKLIT